MERRDADTGEVVPIATLSEGDYFGEAALINNDKRAATIIASDPTTCLVLKADDFNKLFEKSKLVRVRCNRMGTFPLICPVCRMSSLRSVMRFPPRI